MKVNSLDLAGFENLPGLPITKKPPKIAPGWLIAGLVPYFFFMCLREPVHSL
jgi:hypothetical protein